MDLPYLKNFIYTHILENQNHYAESKFKITDQFMIDINEYLFKGACTLDFADVVIAATAYVLRMLVIIVQNVKRRVAATAYVPVINASCRGSHSALQLKSSCNYLADHYDAIVDMTPEDIIQQYEMKLSSLMCHINQKCAEMMVPN